MVFATPAENGGSVRRFVPALLLALMVYLSAPGLIVAQDATGDVEDRVEEKLLVTGDFSTLLEADEWGRSEEERKKILEKIEVLVEVQRGAYTGFYDAAVETLQQHIAVILIREHTRLITRARVYFSRRDKDKYVHAMYEQAPILERQTVTFFNHDFEKLCQKVDDETRNCPGTDLSNFKVVLHPAEDVQQETVKVLRPDLAVVELMAPVGYQPEAVIIKNPNVRKDRSKPKQSESVLARTLPGPGPVRGEVNVSFTVLDPETVKKNFGTRIASRYVVADLQIRNPSSKKVQLKKSAVWFEVDYVTAKNQKGYDKVKQKAKNKAEKKTSGEATVYRYRLEHCLQPSPHTFLSVLGVFDQVAGWKEDIGRIADLIVAVAAGLSGFVGKGETFPNIVNLISGIIVPRGKQIFLNPETETRKRTQLLTQSFQEIVQIGPRSSETTKVYLPRRVINNIFPEAVVILQIRDVHVELELVTDVVEERVAKGIVEIGMTEDQVEQALGRADKIEPSEGGGSKWSYDKGQYKSITFGKDKRVIGREPRSVKEQLEVLRGEATIGKVKGLLRLPFAPNEKPLWDGGFVWLGVRIPGETDTINLRFGDGKLGKVDYKTAYERVKELVAEKKKRKEIENELLTFVVPESRANTLRKEIEEMRTKNPAEYPSPDVKREKITVTYKEDGEDPEAETVTANPPRE